MKKIFFLLLINLSSMSIFCQQIDYNILWTQVFQDSASQKFGLLKNYYGKRDTLVNAKYDEIIQSWNDTIDLGRDGNNWFAIYKNGLSKPVNSSKYIGQGCFLVPANGKYNVYSALKEKNIITEIDSVKMAEDVYESYYPIMVFKNNLLYNADLNGNLVFAHRMPGAEGEDIQLIYENSKINQKDKSLLYGLLQRSLDDKETILLPVEYTYIHFEDNNVLCIAKNKNDFQIFNGLLKPILVSEAEPEKTFTNFYKYKNKGKLGLINSLGETILPALFDSIDAEHYWQITVKNNNKYGYYSLTGKEIFPCQFENNSIKILSEKEPFYIVYSIGVTIPEDKALYCYDDNTQKKLSFSTYQKLIPFKHLGKKDLMYAMKENRWGIIDWDNNILVPFEYDTIGAYLIPDGFTMFSGLYPIMKNGLYGFLSSDFKIFVEPKFENLDFTYLDINSSNAFLPVRLNNKWGILNYITKSTSTCIYDTIITSTHYNNMGSYFELTAMIGPDTFRINNAGQRIYDQFELFFIKTGKEYYLYYTAPDKPEVQVLSTPFNEAYNDEGFNFKVGKKNGKYQVIDLALNLLGTYDKIEMDYSETLVKVLNNKKSGLLAMNGTEVVPCLYDEITSYEYDFYSHPELRVVKRNGKLGMVNLTTYKEVVPCLYDYFDNNQLFEFDSELNIIAVKRNGKWGLLNLTTGKEALPCTIDKLAQNYEIDLAEGSLLLEAVTNKKAGLYSCTGKEILACEYDHVYYIDYEHILYEKNNKFGAVNNSLQIILPPIYDEILFTDNEIEPSMPMVKQNGKYALFSSQGKQITPFQFDNYFLTEYNIIGIINNKYEMIDTTGRVIISPNYDDMGGYSGEYFWARKDGKYGFLDKNEKTVIPFMYETVREAADTFFIVYKNGKYGVVNLQNETVIPFEYDNIRPNVLTDKGLHFDVKKEFWGLLDIRGKIIIPLKYGDRKPQYLYDNRYVVFVNGKAGIYDSEKGEIVTPQFNSISRINSDGATILFSIGNGKKTGMMNQDGKILHPPDLDEISSFGEGLFVVINKKKYGFMDTNGNIVIPCQYDAAEYFKDGRAFVTTYNGKKDKKKFFIDKNGNEVKL